MDKNSVKAALGKRRLQSQHKLDGAIPGSPDHEDLGSNGGQPTQSSGGAMVSISVQPMGVDAASNASQASAGKLANGAPSAVKQPKQESTAWNQGGKASEVPNGMHQVVNGESGDTLRAKPSDQQGPGKALMSKILNEEGISPMRKAMSKASAKKDSAGNA